MNIGFIGLGKMGSGMVNRLLLSGHQVVAFDVDEQARRRVKRKGAKVVTSVVDLVSALPTPKIIWLMLPHEVVGTTLAELFGATGKGTIIIDGGNSNFNNTITHSKQALKHGIHLVDAGVSGGVLGEKNGYCISIGGNQAAYKKLLPIFRALAQPNGYAYFGVSGSGHYVKMVHNGIEYGLMQSYAEGYQILKEGPFKSIDLGQAASLWQHGSIISSDLNQLAAQVLKTNQDLEQIGGVVAESGEARWTLETAKKYNISSPAIRAAFDVRLASQKGKLSYSTKLLAALRNAFGGHNINPDEK